MTASTPMTDTLACAPASPAVGGSARLFRLTERAARRLAAMVAAENNPALMLRLSVAGGGCSGFQYGFSLDDSRQDDDTVIEQHGVRVVIDDCSLGLLVGSELDFVEDLMGSQFQVNNPNATASCGCGASFSV